MAVTAVLLGAILAVQLPQVQTFLVGKVTEKLEGSLDGRIEFEKIHIKPFNALIIKNVAITDNHPVIEGADTLFRAEYVIARFTLRGLFSKHGLYIGRAYVSNAEMTLAIEEETDNLSRIFRIPPPDFDQPKPTDPVFKIRRASVYDMTFKLKSIRETPYRYIGYGINWNDLEVNDINVEAHRIDLTGPVMKGVVDYMSFTEKSGYVCSSLTGKATVGNGRALIEEIRLSDPWSELYLPMYSMSYASPLDFEDYINKIRMDGVTVNSMVDMKSISFFAPELKGVNLKAMVSGTVSGTVSDLGFSEMDIATTDGLQLRFDGRMTGIPDIGRTSVLLDLHQLRGTTESLERGIKAFAPDAAIEIGDIARGSEIRLHGHASGLLDNLNTDMVASLGAGYVDTELHIRNLISTSKPLNIEGTISSHNFDIGKILDTDMLRQCSIRSGFRADLGNTEDGIDLEIDSLYVDRLHFNGYDYSNIAAAGIMKKHAFDGRIVCNDPNLNFIFQGVFSLSSKTSNAVYKFYANLGYADLNAMNIDKRGLSKVSLQASANFNRRKNGDLLGSMEVNDVVLENDSGQYDIGDIDIRSYFGDDLYRMRMSSSFADASFSGSAQLTSFIGDLQNITLKRELPALFRDTVRTAHNERYRIAYRGKNSMDLLAFLSPGLYISDSTSLDIRIDTAGVFTADLKSPRIAYNENYIRNMEMKLNNINGSLTGEITGDAVNIATVTLENNSFKMFAKNDFVGLGYSYENPGSLINRGEVFLTSDIRRDENDLLNFHIKMLPSRLLLNSREWNIRPSALDIKGPDIDIDRMEFTSGDQSIRITGGYSPVETDTLGVRLERFDISVINPILKNRFGIEGAATGEARFVSGARNNRLMLDFLVDSTRLSGADIGVLRLSSRWNKAQDRFDVLAANETGGMRTFRISGSYSPVSGHTDLLADLNGMDISYAQPFLETVFSEMSGHISGKIRAEGPVDELNIYSEGARIDDSTLKVAFTNVPYNASGTFHIDGNGVHFDDIVMTDRYGNRGQITGGIIYDRLKDMRMDTKISINGMECLNTADSGNNTIYGNLFASGNLSITGPFNSLKMDINASTTGAGQLHIPIQSSATAITSNLLTFKEEYREEHIDPYELMMKKITTDKQSTEELAIRLNVEATPEVEAFVEIDKASGNVLRGRGSGNIELELRGEEFNILGDYTLTGGNYRFVAEGLAYKDFTIADGSSIKFNGDIMDSDLNINASYRTKTSLATLIADTSSVSTRRTVDCGINISDKIKSPRLAFSIDIPDIDPTVKSRVESALSTEDKVQRQFLSLVMFNSFLPDDQSGIVNNASVLFSTVTEIMYNQLNNIFQKLEIPLDLGLNFQPNERGQNIFDVAISTQLFNNRVVVNGNLGNRQYMSGNSNSDVVGDLDIEIKLDRPGLFRLNLFSHSADQYTNYLDDSQRNGIGIAYQQEFNTFREFFTNLFTSRKKRNQAPAAAEEPKKTIIISPENGK